MNTDQYLDIARRVGLVVADAPLNVVLIRDGALDDKDAFPNTIKTLEKAFNDSAKDRTVKIVTAINTKHTDRTCATMVDGLPVAHGSLCSWMWSVIYDNKLDHDPYSVTVYANEDSEESALATLEKLKTHGWSNVHNLRVVAPTTTPEPITTFEDAHDKAIIRPIVMFDATCPICGESVLDGSDWGAVEDIGEYVWQHLADEHDRELRHEDDEA